MASVHPKVEVKSITLHGTSEESWMVWEQVAAVVGCFACSVRDFGMVLSKMENVVLNCPVTRCFVQVPSYDDCYSLSFRHWP